MSFPVRSLCLALALSSVATALHAGEYRHDFSSTEGWPDSDLGGDLRAVYTVVGGEYLISPLQNMAYALAPAPASARSADMRVESDVRLAASQAQSRAGIACRVDAQQRFYAFDVLANGHYEIVRVEGDRAEVLRQGAHDYDASMGVRVAADCEGRQLRMYLDGQLLDQVEDDAITAATGAGLLSVSPVVASSNAAFDNFVLRDLAGDSAPRALTQSPPPSLSRETSGGGGSFADGDLPEIEDAALFADDGSGQPGPQRSLFETGQQRVYLVMELARPMPAHFRAVWHKVEGSNEYAMQSTNYDFPGRHRRVWMYLDRAWSAGLYRVDLYANNHLLEQREFSVY